MPRENSFSDSDGRSLTPDLDEGELGVAASSPTYDNRFELPPPVDSYGQSSHTTQLSQIVTRFSQDLPAGQSPVASPPHGFSSMTSPSKHSVHSKHSTRSKRAIPAPVQPTMPPRQKFQSVVRKVMAMHRSTSMMATGAIGAEPGIDPRRASADLMFGHIKKNCLIEMYDYSSTNCMAGRYTNSDFVKLLSDPQASKRDSWVKVRWINIGGLSWDVIKAVSLKYDIHPLALEDVFHTRSQTRSKADYYGKHLFLRILCHELQDSGDDSSSDSTSSSYSEKSITGAPRSSSPIPFEYEDDFGGLGDSKTLYGGDTVKSNWSLKKSGTMRSRRSKRRGTQMDMEMGPLDEKRNNSTWSFSDSRKPDEARLAALKNGDRVQVRVAPMFIFLFRDGTVISMQKSSDLSIMQPISQRIQQRDTGLRTSADPSMLVQSLLDLIVDKALEVIDEYHSMINKFEAEILLSPSMKTVRNCKSFLFQVYGASTNGRNANAVHIFSGDLIMHKRTLEPIKTLIYGLRRYDLDRAAALVDTSLEANKDVKIVGYMSHKSKIYLADVHDHMEYILSSVEMFAGIGENLIDYTFNMTSYEMNEVMRRLTLATIICLPLTILTGYFGMNFTPFWAVEQHSDLLFWEIAIPVMVVVVPLFLFADIKRGAHYLMKRMQSEKASKVCVFTVWTLSLRIDSLLEFIAKAVLENPSVFLAQNDQIVFDTIHNATSIVGTWASGSKAVQTGPGFANPSNQSFTYPAVTGISYSFSDDGWYEIARYRFNSNGSEPNCITGAIGWVHGHYNLLANGSIVMTPNGDGYQQIQDPCAAVSNFMEDYNLTELYTQWRIFTDPVDGYKLHLFQFDGAPLAPQFQISTTPQMLPTRQLRNVTAPTTVLKRDNGAESRAPSQQYLTQNGFTEPPQTLQQKIELHEVAMDTLRLRAVPAPSLQELLETDWKPERETPDSVKQQIEKLRSEQKEFLSKLYDLNAQAYLEDVESRYLSRDEALDKDPKEYIEEEKESRQKKGQSIDDLLGVGNDELERMAEVTQEHRQLFDETYPYPFSPTSPYPGALPSINRHNYIYLKRYITLQQRLRQAKIQQAKYEESVRDVREQKEYNDKRREEEQRRQEEERKRALPETVKEFNEKDQSVKERVARFLSLTKGQSVGIGLVPPQEAMLKEYKWNRASAMALMEVYRSDETFRAEIQALQVRCDDSRRKPRDPRTTPRN
ncbi:hypothetical protein D9758_009966 [Tetrapyrgos nigripes]|uniref:Protein rot1 n=1 Tax=Tetrapyrgos nigripes TaxID=182062 RepID=A0A8H5CQJ1_9AGAR|nr:hypothetical protein D9758_009966 [Tetrapyrgos nigripes]